MKGVNWLGLVLALVAAEALGFLWYGMVFEEKWMALSGIAAPSDEVMTTQMLWGVVNTLVIVAGLALAIPRLGKETLAGGATVGLAAALFFAVPTVAMDVIYSNDPLELGYIDGAYLVIAFAIAGALIGGVKMPRRAAVAT